MPNIASFRAVHVSGTATTTPAKVITKRGRGFRLRIKNTDTTNDLEISFDSGNTFYPISPGAEWSEDVVFHYFYLQSSAATATYSGLMFEG